MRFWNYIKSFNRTSLVVISMVITIAIFTIWQIFTPTIIYYHTEKVESPSDLGKEVVYYGVPSVIHSSQRYYKFNRYDLNKNKIVDLDSPDSIFWAETDYANVIWEKNGEQVFSNKWISLIHKNPEAIFKITGTITKDDCYERVDNPILSQEFCAKDAPEFALVVNDMEIFDTSKK